MPIICQWRLWKTLICEQNTALPIMCQQSGVLQLNLFHGFLTPTSTLRPQILNPCGLP